MSENRPTNYGSTASRVPEVGFSGGGSVYGHIEVEAVSENVSKTIYAINNGRIALEKSAKLIGTSKDSRTLRDKMESTVVSIKDNVIKATNDIQHLKRMTRKGGWQQKLQVQKITESFEESLKMCKPVEELAVAKMRSNMLPLELAMIEQEGQEGADLDNQRLTTTEMRQATENLEFEHGLLKEREMRMEKIANNIIDIHQIMKELGAQVHDQSEDIDMIENAIEEVHNNIEGAHDELEKAATHQITHDLNQNEEVRSDVPDDCIPEMCDMDMNKVENCHYELDTSRRKKVCFLILISVTIGIILTVIIAVSLRKG